MKTIYYTHPNGGRFSLTLVVGPTLPVGVTPPEVLGVAPTAYDAGWELAKTHEGLTRLGWRKCGRLAWWWAGVKIKLNSLRW